MYIYTHFTLVCGQPVLKRRTLNFLKKEATEERRQNERQNVCATNVFIRQTL